MFPALHAVLNANVADISTGLDALASAETKGRSVGATMGGTSEEKAAGTVEGVPLSMAEFSSASSSLAFQVSILLSSPNDKDWASICSLFEQLQSVYDSALPALEKQLYEECEGGHLLQVTALARLSNAVLEPFVWFSIQVSLKYKSRLLISDTWYI